MSKIEPTPTVKKYAPWSISKAQVAKQCPHRFYLQYIKKKRMDLPPSYEALIGTAVHSILEYAVGGLGQLSVSRCFKLAAVEHKLTTRELEEVRGLIPAVENFIKKFGAYCKRLNAEKPVLEQRLAIGYSGEPRAFWDNKNALLRGVLDLSVRFRGKPHALILDHKTGKEHSLDFYKNQFNSYAILLKAKVPDLEKIKLGINFVRADRVDFVKEMVDVRGIDPLLNNIVEYLNEATRDADNSEVAQPGPLCGWCDYRSICPAHMDGTNGKEKG